MRDATATSARAAARKAGACPLEEQEGGEQAHPEARASRPHALPSRAAQFPRDEAPGRHDGDPVHWESPLAGTPLAFLGGVAETPSRPPLTLRTSPVIQVAAGLQRNATP